MTERHVTNKLSPFIDGELRTAERQTIGEHILNCEICRREHDCLRTGALLAGRLGRSDASAHVWSSIEGVLSTTHRPGSLSLSERIFRSKMAIGYAFGVLSV